MTAPIWTQRSTGPDSDLIEAAGAGSLRLAKLALEAGADALGARDVDGATALMLAAHNANPQLVNLFLPLSDPTLTDQLGWSALTCAAAADSTECAELLLPRSNPLERDVYGRIAIDFVKFHGGETRWAFLRVATQAALERVALGADCPEAPAAGAPPRL